MACGVCEHCHGEVKPSEKVAVCAGFSYHEKCHKCYVCSETNLQNAEVFKGVIFCSSCSKRIFQGCSTVRRTKKSREKSTKSHRRRSHRTQDCRFREGILELSALAGAVSSSSEKPAIDEESIGLGTDMKVDVSVIQRDLKKSSVEMGVTTDVTQQLLREMQCPVPEEPNPAPLTKPRRKKREPKKKTESDLRMAELGASTEIANMALRYKSEMPVIIKNSELKKSRSVSEHQEKSDDTGGDDEWLDSAYSSLRDSIRTRWMDRRLRSILKIPLESFKKNILTRSSLISDLASEKDKETMLSRLKLLFNEEITEHQRRGLKRLYSTINRQKIPNELGWLHIVTKRDNNGRRIVRRSSQTMRTLRRAMKSSSRGMKSSSDAMKSSSNAMKSSSYAMKSSSDAMKSSSNAILISRHRHKKCKHFKTSHSYRCMRNQAMRNAGPTSSELACFREKIRNMVLPKILWNVTNFIERQLRNM